MIETKTEKPLCFVIMPFTEGDAYEKGHFKRVYEHVIVPACREAEFEPIRADEEFKTNFIILDVIKRIVESPMVLCDLSGNNPNVLYELGIRQAFNRPVTLIKDYRTEKIFDIQGLRYKEYDQMLRIDNVQKSINEIAESIRRTHRKLPADVNSLVQLLGIEPASIPIKRELSPDTSIILSAINDISNRMSILENKSASAASFLETQSSAISAANIEFGKTFTTLPEGSKAKIGDKLYMDGNEFGILSGINKYDIVVKKKNGEEEVIPRESQMHKKLSTLPF